MTKSMRTAAYYDYKNHTNPAYVRELRARLEEQRIKEIETNVSLKPKTWGI